MPTEPANVDPNGRAPAQRGNGFAVGVATVGYQVEGGYNGEGEPSNNWYDWERSGRVARSGVACDFWAHPEEVLDRAAAIGCTTFCLSVEWARLEPRSGQVDDTAAARYVEILQMCVRRGMEPIVTLHHFTHPGWLGEEFWLRPGSPDRFARHVRTVVPLMAPYCRRWITINEPDVVMWMGWIRGAYPPGRRLAVADALCVLDNLLSAHVLASDVIMATQPDALVASMSRASSLYERQRLQTDLLLVRSAGVRVADVDRYIDERRAFHDAAVPPGHGGELAARRVAAALSPYGTESGAGGGRVWSQLRSATRRRAPRRVLDVVRASPQACSMGAIGLALDGAPPERGAWLRAEAAVPHGLPLWVVGTGREQLEMVVDAVGDGIPVTTYLHRSLVDGYLWGAYDTDAGGNDAASAFAHALRRVESARRTSPS